MSTEKRLTNKELKERLEQAEAELQLLRSWAGNGADEERWPPGMTISEAVLARLVTLQQIVDTLGQPDSNWEEKYKELKLKVTILPDVIAHGTPEYQAWLREAIEKHFQDVLAKENC